jgi:hypothetical protein
MLRDGLIVAFFRQAPFAEWAAEVASVFELWLQTAPPEAIAFAAVGARASDVKPVRATTLARCRGQLDAKKAAQREISSFEIGGAGEVNPDWLFDVWGGTDAVREDDNDRTNFVQMRLPTAWLDEGGDNLQQFALACAERLTFDSGYASLALHWSTEAELVRAGSKIPGIGLRHPGLDLHDHKDLRFSLGRRCVGARWLTLLGPELAEELGGEEELRDDLPPSVEVSAIAHGVALRAEGPPAAGDVNLGDSLPAMRAMAETLEPVTHFVSSSRLLVDPDALERWQRRWLD